MNHIILLVILLMIGLIIKMPDKNDYEHLNKGLINFDINLTDLQKMLLLDYCYLLEKWNRYYSLTSIKTIENMISHHIFDALTLVNHIYKHQYKITNVIDIGSGMGVPAIVLAICFPNLQVYALDCNNKKIIFLKQVAIELNLKNLHIINKKIEDYNPDISFNLITARAFANIEKLINLTKHIVNANTFYLLMKSKKTYEELEYLESVKAEIYDVKIPNYKDIRYIVKVDII